MNTGPMGWAVTGGPPDPRFSGQQTSVDPQGVRGLTGGYAHAFDVTGQWAARYGWPEEVFGEPAMFSDIVVPSEACRPRTLGTIAMLHPAYGFARSRDEIGCHLDMPDRWLDATITLTVAYAMRGTGRVDDNGWGTAELPEAERKAIIASADSAAFDGPLRWDVSNTDFDYFARLAMIDVLLLSPVAHYLFQREPQIGKST